ERAARASCRSGRRGAREPADGTALDRTQARYPRLDDHADRLEQYRAHLRLLAARSYRSRAPAAARRCGLELFDDPLRNLIRRRADEDRDRVFVGARLLKRVELTAQ